MMGLGFLLLLIGIFGIAVASITGSFLVLCLSLLIIFVSRAN